MDSKESIGIALAQGFRDVNLILNLAIRAWERVSVLCFLHLLNGNNKKNAAMP